MEYKMKISKRYKVTFLKNGVKHQKGAEVEVGMALASKFFSQGKIKPTAELLADAKELGCEELFTKKQA